MKITPQPLIAVRDVEASSHWYQALLGARSGHGGPLYEQLLGPDGDFFMQLHAWDEEDHVNLRERGAASPGHGVLLWFRVDDFGTVAANASQLGAVVVQDVAVNPNSGQQEIWIQDPDGYMVVVAGKAGALS